MSQMDKVVLSSNLFQSQEAIDSQKFLCDLFKYESCVVSNTGVEADEIAIKIALQWGYKRKGIEPFKA